MVLYRLSGFSHPERLLALLLCFLLSALPAFAVPGATDPVVKSDASLDEDSADEEEPAPRREPLGERPFWTAVLLLSTNDPEKQKAGRDKLTESADLEFPVAQTYLGECYLRGQDGFPRNPRKAVSWLRLAADRGDTIAKSYLGSCYLLGTGVTKDRARAKALFEQVVAEAGAFAPSTPPAWFVEEQQAAAKAGTPAERNEPIAMGARAAPWDIVLARSHFALGLLLDESGDLSGALAMFDAAATWADGRAGIHEAMLRAARARALGRGCARDLKQATELLERSRDLMRSNVMAELHTMWTRREVDDFALVDLEKAVGQMAESQVLQEQQGVAASLLKESPGEARRWCEMAAEAGEVWAMLELAEILRLGLAGAADPEGAFQLYRKAYDSGKSWVAAANLVVCHRRGWGTPVDDDAAAVLIARHGDSNFACALAGVGLAPAAAMAAKDWHALLDVQAKSVRHPVALFHSARFDYLATVQGRTTKQTPSRKAITATFKKAADEGVAAAHRYLAYIYGSTWTGLRDDELVLQHLSQGVAMGDLICKEDLAFEYYQMLDIPNLRRAIALQREVLEVRPDSALGHNNLAAYYEVMANAGESIPDIERTEEAIIYHLERAEELGSSLAARNLARRYERGLGVEKDLRLAYTYYQSAADKGDIDANRILGTMHEKGIGVPVTLREAMHYYRIAALDGDPAALRAVCDYYMHGIGVERDLEAAKFWLARLARMGEIDARVRFGDVLMAQGLYGEARGFWVELTGSGMDGVKGVAYHRLGRIYREGLGVSPDSRRAMKYQRMALKLRNPDAIYTECLDLISAGKAAAAVPKLEALGPRFADAEFLLGSIRLTGDGVPRDVKRGLENLRRSSDRGSAQAKYMLALATLDRLEGAPTADEALKLLDAAAAAGHPKAGALRPEVESLRAKSGAATVRDEGRSGPG